MDPCIGALDEQWFIPVKQFWHLKLSIFEMLTYTSNGLLEAMRPGDTNIHWTIPIRLMFFVVNTTEKIKLILSNNDWHKRGHSRLDLVVCPCSIFLPHSYDGNKQAKPNQVGSNWDGLSTFQRSVLSEPMQYYCQPDRRLQTVVISFNQNKTIVTHL